MDNVKEENLRLKSENQVRSDEIYWYLIFTFIFKINQVLGQYIENLMTASQVFQTTEEPRYK